MENQSDPKAVMSVYGFAEEATKFDLRHPLWHQRMPRLAHAIDLAFTRIQTMNTPEGKFVYFYGTLAGRGLHGNSPRGRERLRRGSNEAAAFLLVALEIQNERFTIEGLEAEMQGCLRDWAEILVARLATAQN